ACLLTTSWPERSAASPPWRFNTGGESPARRSGVGGGPSASRDATKELLVLLCDFLSVRSSPSPRLGSLAARRQLAGGGVPVVDARLLVTPQHTTDRRGDALRARGRLPTQVREDRPHLRHGHRRGIYPPDAAA